MKAFVTLAPASPGIAPEEVAIPAVGPGELLVRMRAVGVGIHDSYFLPQGARYPYPIGIEGAGVVEEVGAGAATGRPGDRIAFVSSMQPKGGTWAEYAVVDSGGLILPIPEHIGFVEAAALPVAGNTALRALAALDGTAEGAAMFIAGGAGAIGTLAIQTAHRRGWRVAASASARNHDYMRSLGAEVVVDYHDDHWPDQITEWADGGVDAAIAIHPGTTSECLPAVRDGGQVITVSGDSTASARGVRINMIDYKKDVGAELARMLDEVGSGTQHLEIERVYPFDEAEAALARVQTRHVRGKLVLRL